MRVGFHASHEQLPPSRLLADVGLAQDVGFALVNSSDHFSPWSERQGESGFAWSWLGAAMGATSLPFSVVNAPGQRYHPAIIAQAATTLDELFPDRFALALGTGEASNEHITGQGWPPKPQRQARLRECVDVMRALFAGEEVTHHGLVVVDRARLWTLPPKPPALLGCAVTLPTARWVAGWADGLFTINQPRDHLERMVAAYREAGGRGRLAVQVHLSWAREEDDALAIAHDQWRTNIFAPDLCWDLETVAHFDEAGRHVRPDDLRAHVHVSADLGRHAAWLAEYAELGFDDVVLHHVGRDQRPFLEAFGANVLPALGATREPA
jgi:probable non-F420 flavinoid oxidoreductase